jgi:transcriptional regulator GlxA family with amidase domain
MPVRTAAIAIHEGVQALDVAGPVDVFCEANGFMDAREQYRTVLVGRDCNPLRASNGIRLMADCSYDDASEAYAMVLVAGGPALPEAGRDELLCAWLHQVVPAAALHGSICTGAFALGHAGFLNGRVVTTHWQNAARLAALFPEADVQLDRIYVRDGRLVTSAGVTAGIDLALALVAEDHGHKVALAVAKRLVVMARRQGGQSQFSPYLTASGEEESPMTRIQAHVMGNLRASLTAEALARFAGMSARNLARLFAQEAGVTPHEFVERARVDAARNLLEGTGKALKAIAYECGFGTADHMRSVFVKGLGISPTQYRAGFQMPGNGLADERGAASLG